MTELPQTTRKATQEQLLGCLWGLALGDAIGLPREGVSPQRAGRMFGEGPLEHRFFGRYGMISDDTEHHCMTAQAWLAAQGQPKRFSSSLAWRLRGWLLGLPAGVGFATLRALVKLWIGFSPDRSGVFSAGNGPAMRAPILGLLCEDLEQLRTFVRASTRLTHTDPKAEAGAFLVACAARLQAGLLETEDPQDPQSLLETLLSCTEGDELHQAMLKVQASILQDRPTIELIEHLGLQRGITGYINHTVPVAIYCWLRRLGDFRGAVEMAVQLGGDTDTVAAIVGGIVGAGTKASDFPASWCEGMLEKPRSMAWMERLASALAKEANSPLFLAWPLLPLRNLFFFCVVLFHGFRRLFPPY